MSPRPRPSKMDRPNCHVLVRKCLAIMLRPITFETEEDGDIRDTYLKCADDEDDKKKESEHKLFEKPPAGSPELQRRGAEGPGPPTLDGTVVFKDLVKENSECYWNPTLVQSVRNLEYKGCVTPSTLLVSGSEYTLEVVRSAWARRVLRPPVGFHISMLGDLDPMDMSVVPQTQFAPLPEALCKVVYDLTSEGDIATLPFISAKLKSTFPEMVVPRDDILYRALGTLIRERKLYHTGEGYSVVTPDTFRLLAMSPPLERQMLLTNEEAIVRLHGPSVTVSSVDDGDLCRTASTQTTQRDMLSTWSSAERILSPNRQNSIEQKIGKLKRSHSLRILRGRDKEKIARSNSFRSPRTSPVSHRESRSDPENHDPNKKEKGSMLSKLFRLGRGDSKANSKLPKCASFSAQFPPSDWSDPDFVHFHSRATQTLERENVRSKSRSSSLNRMSSRERHAHNVASTPVTPKTHHRSHQSTDVYHYRSSSLPRRSTPSPKPDVRRVAENSNSSMRRSSPKTSRRHQNRHQNQSTSKPHQKCHQPPPSPFKPYYKENGITEGHEAKSGLRYPDMNAQNVPSYRPLTSASTLGSFSLTPFGSFSSRRYVSPGLYQPPWRTMTVAPSTAEQRVAIGEPMKQPTPMVFLPQRTLNREVASVPPSKTVIPTTKIAQNSSIIKHADPNHENLSTKPININIKDSRKVDCGLPKSLTATNEVHLDGSVDVEISVGSSLPQPMKKGVLHTDIDSEIKKDLLKIATTWNHSISNSTNHSKLNKPNPTLTTTTSITTSLSHGGLKEQNKKETLQSSLSSAVNSEKLSPVESCTAIDSEEACAPLSDASGGKSSPSPRSRMAEAKAAFFDSPSPPPGLSLIHI